MEDYAPIDCLSHNCEWSFDLDADVQPMTCITGSGDCVPFHLLELLSSTDNTNDIMELTAQINKLVDKANKKPPETGYRVTLILYQQKLFLKWVNHSKEVLPGKNVVTGKDKPEVVARALGVKGLTAKDE